MWFMIVLFSLMKVVHNEDGVSKKIWTHGLPLKMNESNHYTTLDFL